MVTQLVPMRAVDLSIGPFCTFLGPWPVAVMSFVSHALGPSGGSAGWPRTEPEPPEPNRHEPVRFSFFRKTASSRKRSHRNSVQNGPVERSTALTGSIFVNIYEKTSFSQKRSHRNSGQNGPIERSTALMGTIFVTISVFMSRGNFRGIFCQLLTDLLLARSIFNERSGTVHVGSSSS